jgi:hypothetical protein
MFFASHALDGKRSHGQRANVRVAKTLPCFKEATGDAGPRSFTDGVHGATLLTLLHAFHSCFVVMSSAKVNDKVWIFSCDFFFPFCFFDIFFLPDLCSSKNGKANGKARSQL